MESSSPGDGEVVKEELKEITLTFGGKLEQGSTFTVQNSGGEQVAVENITIADNQLVGTLSSPLENGQHYVKWDIIGADGHPISGNFSFTVELPVSEAPAEETTQEEQVEKQDDTNEEVQSNVEETDVETTNEEKTEEAGQSNGSSDAMPIIIGVLIVIILVSAFFMLRRKK
ncbi:copper resistance CopC family protein [Lysinibacillus composti]|uniref:copper resistance CopC family protein n=1 Tax=Lysinibacillus composti TaxID=720633 RepID=UPI001F02B3CC|nr:copper resistance CopC family protein [Lysinibacillus composti]